MTFRRTSITLALLLVLGLTSPGWPQQTEGEQKTEPAIDAKKQLLAATAFIEVPRRRNGVCATCIHPAGLFITGSGLHTVAQQGRIKMVLYPGTDRQETITARLLPPRPGTLNYVGLLVAPPGRTYDSLRLPTDPVESRRETAFMLELDPEALTNDKQEIVAPTVLETNYRPYLAKPEDRTFRIKYTGPEPKAKLGSPAIVNPQGFVLGLGADSVVSLLAIGDVLDQPVIEFTPPAVSYQERFDSHNFWFRVFDPLHKPADSKITLTLTGADGSKRTAPASLLEDVTYSAELSPLDADALAATVEFPAATLQCRFPRQSFSLGEHEIGFEHLRRITFGDSVTLEDHRGRLAQGKASGLDRIPVDVGGYQIPLDLTKARRVEFASLHEQTDVQYVLEVEREGTLLARHTGVIDIDFPQPAYETDWTWPVQLEPLMLREPKEFELPGWVKNTSAAGGGRYLLIVCGERDTNPFSGKRTHLVIFDVGRAEVAKVLPLEQPDSLVAGTLFHFVIVSPSKRTVQRWSLADLQKVKDQLLPDDIGRLRSVVAGWASDGPLIVSSADDPSLRNLRLRLFDVNTLEALPMEFRPGQPHNASRIWASGTGGMVTSIGPYSPSGVEAIKLYSRQPLTHRAHENAGHVIPSADGTHVCTGEGVRRVSEIASARRGYPKPHIEANGFACLPTYHPRYYLAFKFAEGERFQMDVQAYGLNQQLAMIPSQDELVVPRGSSMRYMLPDCIHYFPQNNVLATLSVKEPRLHVRTFDLAKEIERLSGKPLYLMSSPPPYVQAGRRYAHQLRASTGDEVKFALLKGPEEMQLSPEGKITWRVPRDAKDELVKVEVSLSNETEDIVPHTFYINVISNQ